MQLGQLLGGAINAYRDADAADYAEQKRKQELEAYAQQQRERSAIQNILQQSQGRAAVDPTVTESLPAYQEGTADGGGSGQVQGTSLPTYAAQYGSNRSAEIGGQDKAVAPLAASQIYGRIAAADGVSPEMALRALTAQKQMAREEDSDAALAQKRQVFRDYQQQVAAAQAEHEAQAEKLKTAWGDGATGARSLAGYIAKNKDTLSQSGVFGPTTDIKIDGRTGAPVLFDHNTGKTSAVPLTADTQGLVLNAMRKQTLDGVRNNFEQVYSSLDPESLAQAAQLSALRDAAVARRAQLVQAGDHGTAQLGVQREQIAAQRAAAAASNAVARGRLGLEQADYDRRVKLDDEARALREQFVSYSQAGAQYIAMIKDPVGAAKTMQRATGKAIDPLELKTGAIAGLAQIDELKRGVLMKMGVDPAAAKAPANDPTTLLYNKLVEQAAQSIDLQSPNGAGKLQAARDGIARALGMPSADPLASIPPKAAPAAQPAPRAAPRAQSQQATQRTFVPGVGYMDAPVMSATATARDDAAVAQRRARQQAQAARQREQLLQRARSSPAEWERLVTAGVIDPQQFPRPR